MPIPERIWQQLSTLQWAHIHLNGSYHFTDVTLDADFRPLREYQGPHLLCAAQSSLSERTEAAITATSEEEMLATIQLPLFMEEESDL